jgi:hypothetical protein
MFSIQAHMHMQAQEALPVLSRRVMAEIFSGREDAMCIFMPRYGCFVKLAPPDGSALD